MIAESAVDDDPTPVSPPATQEKPANPTLESRPASVPAPVEAIDEIAALENLPDPAAGVAATQSAAVLGTGKDLVEAENNGRLLRWPTADHVLWRALVYGLVALLLAAVAVGYLRRRQRISNAVIGESDSGPRLVDVKRITGHGSYSLENKMARICRKPGANTANVVTVHIPHDVISRAHAFIDLRDGAYWVTDPGSNNGTFVNDQRVDGSRMLHHGDRIRFATFDFVFENPPRASVSAPAGTSTGSRQTNDGDRTVLVGQGETEFVPVSADVGAETVAAQGVTQGERGEVAAKPESTVVRPAR